MKNKMRKKTTTLNWENVIRRTLIYRSMPFSTKRLKWRSSPCAKCESEWCMSWHEPKSSAFTKLKYIVEMKWRKWKMGEREAGSAFDFFVCSVYFFLHSSFQFRFFFLVSLNTRCHEFLLSPKHRPDVFIGWRRVSCAGEGDFTVSYIIMPLSLSHRRFLVRLWFFAVWNVYRSFDF